MTKADLDRFLMLVNALAPVVLEKVKGGDKVVRFIPSITQGIVAAEQIKGATGAEKKARVLEIVAAGVATANATGQVKLNPAAVAAAASGGIDAVINTIHAIEGGKIAKPAA
jgi:hypothetical protein